MDFQTLAYLIFYIITFLISWQLIYHKKIRLIFLLIASYFFYGFGNYYLVLLLFSTTLLDYIAALIIDNTSSDNIKRKFVLVMSIIINLGVLGYFKYMNFFADSLFSIASFMGFKLNWVDLNILLPVGISFYTFESMSYTIDVYKKIIPAERSFLNYAFFISFFPKLIAGPIVRPKDFLPQLHKDITLTLQTGEESLFFICRGLLKKIILADFLSVYADILFNPTGGCDMLSAWVGMFAFSFQIYFDFSGYSDIAIGCTRLLGYNIPINFKGPYVAQSFSDFWKRWHISLSSWLRDYLYIPLGGNRVTKMNIYRNLMITMLLGGLWHGANLTFIIWGFLHGSFLVCERLINHVRPSTSFSLYPSLLKKLLIFLFISLTWVVFRAQSLPELEQTLIRLITFEAPKTLTGGTIVASFLIICSWFAQLMTDRQSSKDYFLNLPFYIRANTYIFIIFLVMLLGKQPLKPFIYFRF